MSGGTITPYIDEASGGDRWRFDSGLLTASRFRPVSRSFQGFGLGGIFGADFLAEKGVVALDLDLGETAPGSRLQLFHTHLQSQARYRSVRQTQLRRVASFIQTFLHQRNARHESAGLLMGDLNIAGSLDARIDRSSEYADLLGLLGQPRDVFREVNPHAPGLTHPSIQPRERLDYVLAFDPVGVDGSTASLRKWRFIRSRVNPDGDAGVSLSDHLPLEAELELDLSPALPPRS